MTTDLVKESAEAIATGDLVDKIYFDVPINFFPLKPFSRVFFLVSTCKGMTCLELNFYVG